VSLERGKLEIVPEPTAQERAAIVAAVERLAAEERGSTPGAWWEAGLHEGLADEPAEDL
jgi:hypothetical protein